MCAFLARSTQIAIPQIQSSNIEAVIQQATLAQDGDSIAAATAGAIALGRVYTATSLPSHIWSLNGESSLRTLLNAVSHFSPVIHCQRCCVYTSRFGAHGCKIY